MDNIILVKKNEEPFITKDGFDYYIEGVKYIDDLEILFNAISQVKEIQYKDLFKPENNTTMQDHWNTLFNYQWSGGNLVLWHDPTELWKQELTRQGKLNCNICGTKLQMYYTPYCPICNRENQKKNNENYNLIQMIEFIEEKNKIDHRNYKNNDGVFNWWIFLYDIYDFRNDSELTINFSYIMKKSNLDWQKEICQMFIDEYGVDDIKVKISW